MIKRSVYVPVRYVPRIGPRDAGNDNPTEIPHPALGWRESLSSWSTVLDKENGMGSEGDSMPPDFLRAETFLNFYFCLSLSRMFVSVHDLLATQDHRDVWISTASWMNKNLQNVKIILRDEIFRLKHYSVAIDFVLNNFN